MSGNWKKINICPTYFIHFNLESFFIVVIMKNLTDLHKSMETGVDPHLKYIVFKQFQNTQPP